MMRRQFRYTCGVTALAAPANHLMWRWKKSYYPSEEQGQLSIKNFIGRAKLKIYSVIHKLFFQLIVEKWVGKIPQ
jgi:hypothetical protein